MSIFVPEVTRSPQTLDSHVERIIRRLTLWSVVCIVSAVPSFLCANRTFDRRAMVCGVGLFIIAYTAATSTSCFERFHDLPYVRTTLYVGYVARLVLSVLFPLGLLIDGLPGVVSVSLVQGHGGFHPPTKSFGGTLATTIIQGTLLNIMLAVFMSAVYFILRVRGRSNLESQPRGFDVIIKPDVTIR